MDEVVRTYFRHRIDWHVNGMLSTRPRPDMTGVRVVGDVTDRDITVTYASGKTEVYHGGRYATRKINGCYAPLMPTKGLR